MRADNVFSRTLVLSLIFVSCFSLSLPAVAGDLPEGLYHIEISDEDLNAIQELFPEYGGVHPSFINTDTDPNIHLVDEAEISVTFIDEGAGYRNSFGYFTFDNDYNILSTETIFENASKAGGYGGSLRPGDTVDIGTFEAGTHIGFWLAANGYNNPRADVFYTLDQYNPDGLRHMAIASDESNGRLIIGIEDIYGLGDEDYNDVVFTFSANPYTAMDTGNIPTGAPEPGAVAASCICFGLFTLFGFGRRK